MANQDPATWRSKAVIAFITLLLTLTLSNLGLVLKYRTQIRKSIRLGSSH